MMSLKLPPALRWRAHQKRIQDFATTGRLVWSEAEMPTYLSR